MKGYQFPDHPTPVKVTDTVCVIGAGNVAMDAARTAKRLGAKNVYIVYRRGPEEVPARAEEVHHAKEEGIIFKLLTNPVKIEGEDGWVKSMECVEMELGEPDASGRRRPISRRSFQRRPSLFEQSTGGRLISGSGRNGRSQAIAGIPDGYSPFFPRQRRTVSAFNGPGRRYPIISLYSATPRFHRIPPWEHKRHGFP